MKKFPYHYYRHPRTTQEARRNSLREEREYVRGARLPSMLPNSYDDISIDKQKSWKHKRRKQYRVGGRGKEYNYYIADDGVSCRFSYSAWWQMRKIEEYFETNNIPYSVIKDLEIVKIEKVQTHITVCTGTYLVYRHTTDDQPPKIWYYGHTYEKRELETPVHHTYKYSQLKGYKIRWWTNKTLDLSELGICP